MLDVWLSAGLTFLGTELITESRDFNGASCTAAVLLAYRTQAHPNSCCPFFEMPYGPGLVSSSSHQQRNREN